MKMAFNGGGGGGGSMAAAAFDGNDDGLRIGNGKVKMEIDTSGGGWRRWVSAVHNGDRRRWVLAFDGDNVR